MTKPIEYTRRLAISVLVLLQVFFYPAMSFAQTADPAVSSSETENTQQIEEEQTPPAVDDEETPPPIQEEETPPPPAKKEQKTQAPSTPTVYGPSKPNGAAGNTFTYNSATGLWENDYYTWDQATQTTKPKKAPVYTYNSRTGLWESVQWIYQPHLGKYMPFTVTFDHNPSPQTQAARTATLAGTGPDSTNTINSNNTTSGQYDNYTTIGITNYITATAFTGDASVYANTFGGNAKSGDALSAANILNMLQSTWAPHIATFEANIDGDVVGDLVIDPTGPNSTNNLNVSNNTNLETNIETDVDITNNVDLVATSGDATVEANTHAGNATSGNADVVVNIINMLNSMITAGESFVGTININGNFEGDILLAQSMLQYLLAHTGPNSTNDVTNTSSNTLNLNVTDNTEINNNISLGASSGDANVTGNTNAGDATSGSAKTNITILNLTGKQVVAENAILVFINVQGRWVGAIVNAPAGSTAAALAGSGPGSTNSVTTTNNINQDIDISNDLTINNNVNAEAHTGDASVLDNTNAGDATTGDASAAANIANLSGSNMQLSKWFGVLFINVFGTWMGSFGENTAYGDRHTQSTNQTPHAPTNGRSETTSNNNATAATTPGTFGFIPRDGTQQAVAIDAAPSQEGQTSSANTDAPVESGVTMAASTTANNDQRVNPWIAVGGITIALSLIGIERYLTFRRR